MRSLPFLHVCIYFFIMSIKSHYISYWLFLPTIRESAILEDQCYATSAFLETLFVSTDTIFVHFLLPYSNHITFYSFLCLYIAVCTLSCWHFRIMTLFVVFVCALSFFFLFFVFWNFCSSRSICLMNIKWFSTVTNQRSNLFFFTLFAICAVFQISLNFVINKIIALDILVVHAFLITAKFFFVYCKL